MLVNSQLTGQVKQKAFSLGADLVGVGNTERWRNAPLMMSPQGILPDAKSVVVCAIHHPDGCIEMGGLKHPQIIGPYRIQYFMNTRLDQISYELARFLEDLGHRAIPIAASNIWRYRPYKELKEVFAPDMSHIYAAVAAGLAELGYNGLALTPEFGARNRFVSVITTAPLTPTPLLPGDTLCDRCNLCVKHCLAQALSKEVEGTVALQIEGRTYTKARKNLWRCSWGEHFDVDLDLEKPEAVTEEEILKAVEKHGMRGGEMGSCLRYCLPAHLRAWDKSYTNAPRRKKAVVPTGVVFPRPLQEKIAAAALTSGVDFVLTHDAKGLAALGINPADHLPDAVAAMTMGILIPPRPGEAGLSFGSAADYFVSTAALSAARALEDAGYSVVATPVLDPKRLTPAVSPLARGQTVMTSTLFTSAPLMPTQPCSTDDVRQPVENLVAGLKEFARAIGADQVGIAPAHRLADLKPQLERLFGHEVLLVARDKGKRWQTYEPEVTAQPRRIRQPSDYVPGAKSVVVLGVRIPEATTRHTANTPAEAIGPYVFAQYVTRWTLQRLALQVVKYLHAHGARAAGAMDLMGTGSYAASPRGQQEDVFCNRFEAVAAGLGTLGRGGFVLAPGYGSRMRYVALVTDAELTPDAVLNPSSLRRACDGCRACLEACGVKAHKAEEATVTIGGHVMMFQRLDVNRCDWSKRYALSAASGFGYLGSTLDLPAPSVVTAENLAAALAQFDKVLKLRPCGIEMCAIRCPA